MLSSPKIKDLEYVSKRIVKKDVNKKIKSVNDKKERTLLYEYSIKTAMEFKYAMLKERIEEKERARKDVFFVKTKAHLLGSKIHFFNATLHKKDFLVIEKLFDEINKELRKIK